MSIADAFGLATARVNCSVFTLTELGPKEAEMPACKESVTSIDGCRCAQEDNFIEQWLAAVGVERLHGLHGTGRFRRLLGLADVDFPRVPVEVQRWPAEISTFHSSIRS
jgi:hypothetical protein